MDSMTISPDAMRQMATNAGSATSVESVQNSRDQVEQNYSRAETKPDSDTDDGVGKRVDVKA